MRPAFFRRSATTGSGTTVRLALTGENLTYLNFGKTRRDHNHPVSLTMGEARAVESSGRFFARKFDPAVDAEVIRYFSAKYGV